MLKTFFRVIELFEFIMRTRLYLYLPYGFVFFPFHIIFPWTFFFLGQKIKPEIVCYRLQKLGPLFVKLGQLCSTRSDLFSTQWLQAFAQLQDSLSPLPPASFQRTFEKSLTPLLQKRLQVDWERPLASASLAQVFQATLDHQKEVVVKIAKPGIKHQIERDLCLLQILGGFLSVFAPKRLALAGLFSELSRTVQLEIDFRYEQFHADKIASTLTSPVQLPTIYKEFTSNEILVMASFVPYQKLQDLLDTPNSYPQQSKKVAHNLLHFVTHSIFRDGFFHADLHPGNIFICQKSADILLVDFGQVGEISERGHFYLCQLIRALLDQDFKTIASIFEHAGWAPAKGFDKQRFERDLMLVLQPLTKSPLESINIQDVIGALIQVSRRHQLQIQPEFLLAQKVILMAEGLARRLDPSLVPLKVFQSEILLAIKQRYGLSSLSKHWKEQRWRIAHFLLGIEEPTEPKSVPLIKTTPIISMLLFISLGWAVFVSYRQTTGIELAIILWHMLLLLVVMTFLRRE